MACMSFFMDRTLAELRGVARLVEENRRLATLMHAAKNACMVSSSDRSGGMSASYASNASVYSAVLFRSKWMCVLVSFGMSADPSTSM